MFSNFFPAFFLFLIIHSPAFGWEAVAKSYDGNETYYIDLSTKLEIFGGMRVWGLVDLKNPDIKGKLSYRYLNEINCAGRKIRTLSGSGFIKHMASGREVFHTNVVSNWQDVSPGSIDEYILKGVCER